MVPSKLRNVPPDEGSLKLSELVTLNTSKIASKVPCRPKLNGRESRMSHEKYALSRRIEFRRRMWPSGQIRSSEFDATRVPVPWLSAPQLSDAGCAEYALSRLFR